MTTRSRSFGFLAAGFQHLALAVADEAELETLRGRFVTAEVEVTEWLHEGRMRQFLFADNNGIVWEVAWTPFSEMAHAGWTSDDPDPVPTVVEIDEQGRTRG